MTNIQLIQALQASIAPCVLISGDGLLLLSLSNRLSRPIERIRHMCDQIKIHPQRNQEGTQEQIRILYKRSKLLRSAIVCIIYSIIFITFIVLLLFLNALYAWPIAFLINIFFILSLFSLIFSMVFFLLDIHWALDSLKIEIGQSQGV
jgi:Cu/Ag efflux pump CusA